MPDIHQTHIDVALSNLAMRYTNNAFIADQIFPRTPVGAQSGFVPIWGRENLQGYGKDDTRAPGASAIEADWTFSKTPYFCDDHARKSRVIPYEELATGPNVISAFGDPADAALGTLMEQTTGAHEVRTAAIAFGAATYAAANKVTLSGTSQWSDFTNSKPILNIQTGITAMIKTGGKRPNVLVLGREVAEQLFAHPAITGRIANTKVEGATVEDLQRIFQVPRVLVGEAVQRSDAGVNSLIWGKHAALLYVEPSPSIFSVSFAKTLVWASAPGSVGGSLVQRWDESDRSTRGFRISTHNYFDEFVTAADTGYLIIDAVA